MVVDCFMYTWWDAEECEIPNNDTRYAPVGIMTYLPIIDGTNYGRRHLNISLFCGIVCGSVCGCNECWWCLILIVLASKLCYFI